MGTTGRILSGVVGVVFLVIGLGGIDWPNNAPKPENGPEPVDLPACTDGNYYAIIHSVLKNPDEEKAWESARETKAWLKEKGIANAEVFDTDMCPNMGQDVVAVGIGDCSLSEARDTVLEVKKAIGKYDYKPYAKPCR